MDKMTEETRRHFRLVISILLIVLVIAGLFALNGRNISNDQIDLNTGWDATINEKEYPDIVLEDFLFDVAQIGDVLTLSRELPDVGENATIRLWMCHSAIDAYLDGELFYTFGHERVEQYKAVGSGFYFIELPRDYEGRKLTIKLTVGEFDAFGSFEPIVIEPTKTAVTSFVSSKMVSFLGGVFLCVIGIAGFCLTSFIDSKMYKIKQLMFIFQFAFFVGLWTLCNDGIAQLFLGDYVLCQALEFGALFLAPIPILLFMRREEEKGDRFYKISTVLIWLVQTVCLIAFVIVGTGILHFQHFLAGFHILMMLTVIQVIVSVAKRLRKHKAEDKYVFVGCIVLAFGCLIDVGAFYMKKYMHLYNKDIDFVTVLGSIVMVMCLFASYFASVRDRIASSAENEVLEKLAYHDILTGAINRVKYEELLDERDKNEEPYAIMYFDLNGLKTMNDSLGHAYGDSLIKEFSLCLHIVFQGMGEVARLGGDEFAIILPNAGKAEIIGAVNRMQAYIKTHNAESDVKLDTAFGVAFSIEAQDKKSRTVNKLADSRMYEMKKKMKTSRAD